MDYISLKSLDIASLKEELEILNGNDLKESVDSKVLTAHYSEPSLNCQFLSFKFNLKNELVISFRSSGFLPSKESFHGFCFFIFESSQLIQIDFGNNQKQEVKKSIIAFSNLQFLTIRFPNNYKGGITVFSLSNDLFNNYLFEYSYLLPKIYPISTMVFYYLEKHCELSKDKKITFNLLCNQLIYQVLYDFINSEVDSETDSGIEEVRKYLLANLNAPFPNSSELAKMSNMSMSTFKVKFQQRFGVTAKEYFFEEQMKYAIELMSKGFSTKGIAYRLGYANPSNFIHAFKRKYGVPPLRYIIINENKKKPD